jgi:hypothetical protein
MAYKKNKILLFFQKEYIFILDFWNGCWTRMDGENFGC